MPYSLQRDSTGVDRGYIIARGGHQNVGMRVHYSQRWTSECGYEGAYSQRWTSECGYEDTYSQRWTSENLCVLCETGLTSCICTLLRECTPDFEVSGTSLKSDHVSCDLSHDAGLAIRTNL